MIYVYSLHVLFRRPSFLNWGLWHLRRNFDCSLLPWSLIGWRTMVSGWGYSRCLVTKPGENTWGLDCQYSLVLAKKTWPASDVTQCAVPFLLFTWCYSEFIGRLGTEPLLCLTNFQQSRCALDVFICIWDMQWRSLFQQVAKMKRV